MPPNSTIQREFPFTKQDFEGLRQRAMAYAGIQVNDDKYEMYYARLAGRIRQLKFANFSQYVELLDQDESEFKRFINAITTNVTSFGREQHHFDYLKEKIAEHKQPVFRLWSAGCSSGEEPYSIILNTFDVSKSKGVNLDILATDLDTDVLQKAANGVYPLRSIEDYPVAIKRQFFVKGKNKHEGKCRVKPEFRKLIHYEQINLHDNWTHKQRFHGIFCRNVMIYFNVEGKRKIIDRFAEHLEPGGLLFIGHSESLHQISDRFENVGKTIFRKMR